ncbi:uncharacterized protein LOC111679134 isoform X2 [Lucilia cuprina]|uniref:uncharacterized protein LOC111679134 isoform X2 n=1 Tax=Lucilia cuprina TaxID=7375 RepID=UPI001F05F566|nr:uncharacterized protein LOC111679134 isoform X2 [Lucilia cuprina]
MTDFNSNDGEHVIEQLKQSVKSIIEKTGSHKFTHELIDKIHKLQLQLEELSNSDKVQFIHEMKDSFRATIDKIETKLMQHAQFERVYNYSIFAAIIFLLLFIFALFGYKLYKSLMEKELKKQEKLKQKQSKKSKKAN